jgi:hypothetical protein
VILSTAVVSLDGWSEGKKHVADSMKDIRALTDDVDAYREELETRWSALLSYRYIGRNHSSMNTGPVDNTVKLRHDMRNPTGGIMAAPIAITSPEGGTGSDLVAVPNPVIHSCQIIDPARDVSRIEVLSEGLKRGRSMGFSRSRIVDADDHARVIAYTEGQGVSIGTPPSGLERMDLDEPVIEIEDSPDLPPLWKVFGASRRDDGRWVLPELAVELASPDAALHIGPQHILLETAAVDLASELAATDRLQMRGWHVMFLARGKVGPFRVDASADRGPDGYIGVRMTMHDEGNGDRAVTSGSALLEVVNA